MATVIVRSDPDQGIVMEETVVPAHLDDEHSAVQFLERLAWAIEDAHGQARRRRPAGREGSRAHATRPVERD